jgi:hypothetical protein
MLLLSASGTISSESGAGADQGGRGNAGAPFYAPSVAIKFWHMPCVPSVGEIFGDIAGDQSRIGCASAFVTVSYEILHCAAANFFSWRPVESALGVTTVSVGSFVD